METEVLKLQDLITDVINKHIPKKKRCEYSKPWWNKNLKEMRKDMARAQRQWRENKSSYEIFQQKRTSYFAEIKKAKS